MPESESNTREYRSPSRSQLKRDDDALIKLVYELAKLSPDQIQQLPLTEQIIDALHDGVAMPARSAHRRQIKFVAGLLRKIDSTAVKQKLAFIKNQSADTSHELHQVEKWCKRLLSDDKQALTEFLNHYQEADRQRLRQLISNSKKELVAGKPPKSSRQLFRSLRTLQSSERLNVTLASVAIGTIKHTSLRSKDIKIRINW